MKAIKKICNYENFGLFFFVEIPNSQDVCLILNSPIWCKPQQQTHLGALPQTKHKIPSASYLLVITVVEPHRCEIFSNCKNLRNLDRPMPIEPQSTGFMCPPWMSTYRENNHPVPRVGEGSWSVAP